MKIVKSLFMFYLVLLLGGCAIVPESSKDLNSDLGEGELQEEFLEELIGEEEVVEQKQVIDEILEAMSLEEKVAQLFILEMTSLNDGNGVVEVNERVEEMLDLYPVGGVILFKDNIIDEAQTVTLIEDLQKHRRIPLFISVDEEGGRVSRIGNNEKMNKTKLPNMSEVGNTNDPEEAYKIGQILGSELRSLGFNMNFAPVADVNTNPNNPIIGVRAFGSDEYLVANMVVPIVEGMQSEGVGSVLKHFPGHGDTSTDTHLGTTYVEHGIERLRQVEWVPFQAGIEAGAFGVMSAHIHLPNVIEEDVPSTFSKEMMTGYLRNELGFDGLIITDALNMGAISKQYSMAEAAVMAIEAGCDVLLMPIPFVEAYDAVLQEVVDGRLTEERIDASVRRILEVKYNLQLF
jgi:beta-N-acetylhexosaminidase